MPDTDEPVKVDLEPDDALRILLGEERKDNAEECDEDADEE